MATIDTILLFNELDLLEIRINELNGVVDKFLIVQSDKTFSGKRKPLFSFKDINNLARFRDKIVFWDVTDMPEGDDPWQREKHQRNAVAEGLKFIGCKSKDRVILADVDEIPRKEVVPEAAKLKAPVLFQLRFFYYYVNVRGVTTPWWPNLRMANFSDLLPDPQKLRDLKAKDARFHVIPDSGWHFSFLGGPRRIREKIAAFSHHREFDKPKFTSDENLNKILSEKKDIFDRKLPIIGNKLTAFGRKVVWEKVNIDNSYPEYFLKNQEKFEYMIAS